MTDVHVVVLTWQGRHDTLRCLDSLAAAHVELGMVHVVDNASTDGTLDAVAERHPNVQRHQTGDNLGFSAGMNVGVEAALDAGAEYVCVLNNDTVVHPAMLERLVAAAARDPARTAVAPRIETMGEPPTVWFAGGALDHGQPVHLPAHNVPSTADAYETEWLTGCCILAHRSVWQSVGPFDPRFFLLFEDAEWSRRARSRGVRLMVVPQAHLRHEVSASFTGPARLLGSYYYARNAALYWSHEPQRWGRTLDVAVRPHLRAVRVPERRRQEAAQAAFALMGVAAAAGRRWGRGPAWLEGAARRRSGQQT